MKSTRRLMIAALLATFAWVPSASAFSFSGDLGWLWLPPMELDVLEAIETAQVEETDAITIEEIVDGMQAYYNEASSYSATFSQTYIEISGLEKNSKGTVWFKKPGKMRWDYIEPEEKYLISDGSTFWAWEPQYRQYCEQALGSSQLPTALTFLSGQGDIRKDFFTELLETSGGIHKIRLTPKVPTSVYTKLEMEIDVKTLRVTRTMVWDPLGNINKLSFLDAELNAPLPDTNFTFAPPADATHLCK